MATIKQTILNITKATDCKEVEVIQSLWSGYGKISRYTLTGSNFTCLTTVMKTVIVKHIIFPSKANHPRGWNTDISHERKVKSYQVETAYYKEYNHLCNNDCRTAQLIGSKTIGDL